MGLPRNSALTNGLVPQLGTDQCACFVPSSRGGARRHAPSSVAYVRARPGASRAGFSSARRPPAAPKVPCRGPTRGARHGAVYTRAPQRRGLELAARGRGGRRRGGRAVGAAGGAGRAEARVRPLQVTAEPGAGADGSGGPGVGLRPAGISPVSAWRAPCCRLGALGKRWPWRWRPRGCFGPGRS